MAQNISLCTVIVQERKIWREYDFSNLSLKAESEIWPEVHFTFTWSHTLGKWAPSFLHNTPACKNFDA